MEVAVVAQNTAVQRPSFEDDTTSRQTVQSQTKREQSINLGLVVLCAALGIPNLLHGGTFNIILTLVVMCVGFVVVHRIVDLLLYTPMRLVRFGACVNTMSQIANRHITPAKWRTWKLPKPRYLAIDPSQRALFIESPGTGYYGLILHPGQIVEAKVEREQTVHTTTRESSRVAFMSSSGFGMIGGGHSKSTTEVVEKVFLEVSYVYDPGSTPQRIVFNFGDERREAEDWALAIRHMCASGRG